MSAVEQSVVGVREARFILFVKDQSLSARFYAQVFQCQPELDVPGMTEFRLQANVVLGLMPENGIARLLKEAITHPSEAKGAPRAELYLTVNEAQQFHKRALAHGARELSPLQLRDWGDEVAYCADPDGHVLAFAQRRAV